ncbi:MAG: FecR family protein [Fermentimonas caenicola]|nr:MAG: FecR family protein [Fermentimonas caenicola]
MNKDLLFKFFEGKSSLDEEKKIREWMEESNSNFNCFMKTRREYDIQILSGSNVIASNKKKLIPLQWIVGAAATIIILIIGGIYLFNIENNIEQYNTIIVPAGQRINLILSDNTNLWLNANTEFRYPTEFSKKNRTVYLDGEAYFEVSKDENKPFIVKTSMGDVHVTGTSFNVEAYSKFDNFVTSLFEGGVDIYIKDNKSVTLFPNELGILENNQFLIKNITDNDHYLWKDGLISFRNKGIEEILISLEKYFDIEIQINTSNLPQHTYTGKFRHSDGVEYALRVLQKSINFYYSRDVDSGIIFIN